MPKRPKFKLKNEEPHKTRIHVMHGRECCVYKLLNLASNCQNTCVTAVLPIRVGHFEAFSNEGILKMNEF